MTPSRTIAIAGSGWVPTISCRRTTFRMRSYPSGAATFLQTCWSPSLEQYPLIRSAC
jgi:hypothetical protein